MTEEINFNNYKPIIGIFIFAIVCLCYWFCSYQIDKNFNKKEKINKLNNNLPL